MLGVQTDSVRQELLADDAPLPVLAYLVLAHESAEHVAALANTILEADPSGHVVIHHDGNARAADFTALKQLFDNRARVHIIDNRVRCGWGRFGLVDGVVRMLRRVREQNIPCDYIYLVSGSCMPTKPLAKLKRFLNLHKGMEFIEAFSADWIVSGLREDRYQYRHWFSFRTHKFLFDANFKIQRALGLKRRFPNKLAPRFGSQWWCLTHKNCMAILDFIDRHPGGYRFFKTTWIPDELFFQSMIASLAGDAAIFGNNLTYFNFTGKGRPVTFYDDHLDIVPALPGFFARKISPSASLLRSRLAEVAAAPDDGELLPQIENDNRVFDVRKIVRRQTWHPIPGQIFYGGQSFSGWPSSMANSKIEFVVLHGPPAATAMVREQLKRVPGVTLLGRIFAPDTVALETPDAVYQGFSTDDVKIRDMDPALYLSRLLARADGVPVIEICPGDAPHAEGYFYYSDKVTFISCQPDQANDWERRKLYWALVAAANPDCLYDEPAPGDAVSPDAVRARIDALIERFAPEGHRKWVNETLLETHQSRSFLRLGWSDGGHASSGHDLAAGIAALRKSRNPKLAVLLNALPGIREKLGALRTAEITASLPPDWRWYFSAGAGKSPEDWAAALDRQPVAHGVLYGIPALTGIVAGHLRGAAGITLLGRVFGPENMPALSPSYAGQSALDMSALDRPLHLTQLLAQAPGFPVIEISPGDDSPAETYFLKSESVAVVACQLYHPKIDEQTRLHWALVAAENPSSRQNMPDESHNRGSLANARRQIDAHVENYSPAEQRDAIRWLLRNASPSTILLSDAPDASLRLPAELLSLHDTLGPVAEPLVRGLSGVAEKLADIGPATIAAKLPMQWCSYFSVTASEPDDWSAVFGGPGKPYVILYGPPAMTREIRGRLAGKPGLTLLGRIFAQGREDTDVSDLARANLLVSLLAAASGIAIVEVCPGDSPAAERQFFADPRAVILSCQLENMRDPDARLLYWALAATAHPHAQEILPFGDDGFEAVSARREDLNIFMEKFFSTTHRLRVSQFLLSTGANGRLVRLSWKTSRLLSAATQMRVLPDDADLASLEASAGSTLSPVIDALSDASLGYPQLTTNQLMAGLPIEWQHFFRLNLMLEDA